MIEWTVGPLGLPASKDWRYWTPQTDEGRWLAWYFPRGLPSTDDELLGEEVTQDLAAELCERHLLVKGNRR